MLNYHGKGGRLPERLRLVIVFYQARLLAFEVDDSIGIGMFAFEVCRNFGSMSFCRVFPRKNIVYVVHDSGKSILGLDIDVDALTTRMTGSFMYPYR